MYIHASRFDSGDDMVFRKNLLLYYEINIYSTAVLILCIGLISVIGVAVFLLCAMPFIALLLVSSKLYDEFIVINEMGLSCYKSKELLWAYEWQEIAALKRSNRFRLPSVEVIRYDANGKIAPFAMPDEYFQLSSAAKKAIKQYYGQYPFLSDGTLFFLHSLLTNCTPPKYFIRSICRCDRLLGW